MKNIPVKIVVLTALLIVAALAQWGLQTHVRAGNRDASLAERQTLADLPLVLGAWKGSDVLIGSQLDFADDAVQRVYRNSRTGQQVTLWIAYSATALDRGHHPEVCMAVLGKPENRIGRALIEVPGHLQPVQQLHFGARGEETWAFYWHYALRDPRTTQQDWLTHVYRRTRQLPPSVTLEVFADAQTDGDLSGARQFVAVIDAEMQSWVGADARRGYRRLPVTIVTGG